MRLPRLAQEMRIRDLADVGVDLLIQSPTLGLTMRLPSRMSYFLLSPVSFDGRILIVPIMKVVPAPPSP